jgi:riboflavin kinase/FMN adenylyltransferase
MRVFRRLSELEGFGPTIVSIGNFDGVHAGHVQVVDQIVKLGEERGLKSLVLAFEPHPVRFLRPDSTLKLLTPAPEKLRLLGALGLDAVLVLPFTQELCQMSPHEFARDILQNGVNAREIHEGYNFRFGHKAAGNVTTLAALGREMDFKVVIYPEMKLRREPVSSSHIRSLLMEGRVQRARHLLERPFSILGTASAGRGYGSKYTVPTINLSPYDELVPKHGVYITRTRVGAETFDSVTNVGNRPTFGADSFAIESHLLDFHPLALHADTPIEICFLHRLRDEVKFPSVDALRVQIGKDVDKTRRFFRSLKSEDQVQTE